MPITITNHITVYSMQSKFLGLANMATYQAVNFPTYFGSKEIDEVHTITLSNISSPLILSGF